MAKPKQNVYVNFFGIGIFRGIMIKEGSVWYSRELILLQPVTFKIYFKANNIKSIWRFGRRKQSVVYMKYFKKTL